MLQNGSVQNEHDIGPLPNIPTGSKNQRRKWTISTPFLNNSRKRGEERGLSLWDAISVLWKLTQDTSRFLSEIIFNIDKIVLGTPTTSFGSRLDLQMVEKYYFGIYILQMPVAWYLSFNCHTKI